MVHGCMVYSEPAEKAAVSCGTSHDSGVSTPLRGRYSKTRYIKLLTHVESLIVPNMLLASEDIKQKQNVESHASAVSLLESGEQR